MTSLRTTILRWVAEAFPALVYGYPRTYVVQGVSDGRLDLVPPPDAPHLEELARVEQWGLGRVTPSPGDEVTVVFRDADPSRPVVVHWGHGTTWSKIQLDAEEVELGEGPFIGVARQEDTVTVLLTPAMFTGTVNGLPASGMILWTPAQTTGTITTSSAKVSAS